MLASVALVSTATLAAGCTPPAIAKRDPVTLRMGVASPKTGIRTSGVQGYINNLLSESARRYRVGWTTTTRLASEWTWSPDGLTLDLRLHDKLQFHDGTPLDSTYLKGNLERVFKKSPSVSYRSVVGVEAPEKDLRQDQALAS